MTSKHVKNRNALEKIVIFLFDVIGVTLVALKMLAPKLVAFA